MLEHCRWMISASSSTPASSCRLGLPLTERQRSILEFPDQWFNDPPQPDRQDYAGRPWLTTKHPDAEAEPAGPSTWWRVSIVFERR